MKQHSTTTGNKLFTLAIAAIFVLCAAKKTAAQVTLSLGSPATYIYGLTSNGEIYEINSGTGSTYRTIKNNSYSPLGASNANGLAYNAINGRFYYFKRNVTESTPQFVSFDPLTNTVTILAASPGTDEVHTGCISVDGKGYYTMDTGGNLYYYNILLNTWTKITSVVVDQFGVDVDAVVRTQSAGDLAIDGYGNIFMVTSSNTNYGLYKIAAPAPTTALASLTVNRVIAPTATTPTGSSIAGIAFDASGKIFMGTRDDKLYLLQNKTTLTSVGNLSSDAGNDLTSLNFPLFSVLPVKWLSFNAGLQNNNEVTLDWKVTEENNSGFYIQHSADGSNWNDVTFVKSRNIDRTEQNYTYTYAANFSGKQYYRIKQLDIDGKESYTAVKVLTFKSLSSTATAWPNPAKNVINIDNNGAKNNSLNKAQVYNLSGKLTLEKQLQQGLNTIDISSLTAGAYIVKAIRNSGDAFTEKIIKL